MRSGKKSFFAIAPLVMLACLALTTVPGVADSVFSSLTVYNPAGQAVYSLTAMGNQESNSQSVFLLKNPSLANPAMASMGIVICDQSPCNAATAPGFISDILGVFPVTSGGQTKYYLGFTTSEADMAFTGSVIGYAIEVPGGIPIKATQFLTPNKQAAGWTATFVLTPGASVPEPGTMVLLSSGVLLLAGVVRRRYCK